MLRKLLESNANIAEARWELSYGYRFAGMLNFLTRLDSDRTLS
jgi:hypothetical protein